MTSIAMMARPNLWGNLDVSPTDFLGLRRTNLPSFLQRQCAEEPPLIADANGGRGAAQCAVVDESAGYFGHFSEISHICPILAIPFKPLKNVLNHDMVPLQAKQ
jgi:hypothetical protein